MRRDGSEPVGGQAVALESARAVSSGIPCPGCGAFFTPSRPNQRHCSDRCRAAASRRREAERRAEWLHQALPADPGRPE